MTSFRPLSGDPSCLVAAPLAPLHAQQTQRFELSGTSIKLHNLIGTLQVEAASAWQCRIAEVTRQGADGAKLTVENTNGIAVVVYPGDASLPGSGRQLRDRHAHQQRRDVQ